MLEIGDFFFFSSTEFLLQLGSFPYKWFHGRVLGVGTRGTKYSSATLDGREHQRHVRQSFGLQRFSPQSQTLGGGGRRFHVELKGDMHSA